MSEPVYLRVYDLSDGAVRIWSPVLLGKRIEGIWHTGISIFGMEYFFGGGIVKLKPQEVEEVYRISPYRVHQLGTTTVTQRDFERYLISIKPNFNRDCYDLIKWNCNNFTDHVSRFLLKRGIPAYILELPEEITTTFMGRIIINFIKMFSEAPAIDSEDAHHPKQTLAVNASFNRSGRRNSCPDIQPRSDRLPVARDCSNTRPLTQQEVTALRRLRRHSAEKRLGGDTQQTRNSQSSDCLDANSDQPGRRSSLASANLPTTKVPQQKSTQTTGSGVHMRRSSVPILGFSSLPSGRQQGTTDTSTCSSARSTSFKIECPSLPTSRPPRHQVARGKA